MTDAVGTEPSSPAQVSAGGCWRVSVSAVSIALAGLALVLTGLVLGRTDVAVLGVPLVLGVVLDWSSRPGAPARVRFGTLHQESRPGLVTHTLELEPAPGVGAVLIRVTAPGHRPALALLDLRPPPAGASRSPSDPAELTRKTRSHRLPGVSSRESGELSSSGGPAARRVALSVRTVRTGARDMFAVSHLQSGPGQVVIADPVDVGPVRVTVLPKVRPLDQLPLPVRLQGLTGPHGSQRPGDGGDLRDINVFVPGDRLRRIDWRATARRSVSAGPGAGQLSQLYVRRTFATADATVMLVLDSRDDVGPDVNTWGDAARVRQDEATSLDLAREAAASLARRYLDAGDRVGLEDLGRLRRPVPPAGGRQQFHRLVQRLALAQPEGEPRRHQRAPRLPSGALVVIFSTFLDEDPAQLARLWRHSGHRVVAVDVLPPVSSRTLPARVSLAYRIVRLERADRLVSLARSGIEVLAWDDRAQVDLAALARQRHLRP
ncbi:MAG TPA: DUF58 domain-containing protein [Propionibacteriaceae bacterium]